MMSPWPVGSTNSGDLSIPVPLLITKNREAKTFKRARRLAKNHKVPQ
jgi:hypothetical protein